jgi:hypothetical protein
MKVMNDPEIFLQLRVSDRTKQENCNTIMKGEKTIEETRKRT